MNYLSEELLNLVFELNAKCLTKLEDLDEETKKRNNGEYIIMRNYIQKNDFYTKELAKATNIPQEVVLDMVQSLGFIRFKNRRLYVQSKYLDRTRLLINDVIIFLNYPMNKKINRSIDNVNSFMKKKHQIKNYKIILLNAFESETLILFPVELLNEMKVILKNGSWGVCMYYFKELYKIYLNMYSELDYQSVQSDEMDLSEPNETDTEETLDDNVEQLESEISINPRDLIEQNQKLNDDLSESRAVCDFLTMQYDDLMVSMDNLKKVSNEQDFRKVFLAFNSIENNKVLDAFFIAKSTLDTLKNSGWEPSPPELKSILYIFDLFAEFFNRQALTTNYKLGEEVSITLESISNFEYKGQELKKGMEVLARVRSPAWYYKGSLITKASVLEIKRRGKE